ncbi:baseplate J/gp47 family protein [Sphingomonas sp. UYP23]
MPFSRPPLTQLIDQVLGDITVGLKSSTGLLRFSNMRVLGKALAKATSGLYGYLDWIAKQATPFTATGEFLIAWGALKGLSIKAASSAVGTISFSGTNGATIPAGAALTRADGVAFITNAAVTITAGAGNVGITAAVAGSAGNAAAGTTMALSQAISGVNTSAPTLTGTSGGAEIEDIEAFRTRVLAKYSSPPQGGAQPDYVDWATSVSAVTRAWVRRNGMGPGTVTVYFMMDIAEAAHGGFPQGSDGVAALETRDIAATGDQLIVADALYAVQPVTALVYAVAPGQNIIGLSISGIAGASTATKAAVRDAFAAAVNLNSSPGGVVLADGTAGGMTQLSVIEAAIAAIPAAAGFVITTVTASNGTVTPGAAGNIASSPGYLAVAGLTVFS